VSGRRCVSHREERAPYRRKYSEKDASDCSCESVESCFWYEYHNIKNGLFAYIYISTLKMWVELRLNVTGM